MKIALRGGHSPNILGAIGIVNEYDEMQKLYTALESILVAHGHSVINCNSTESTQSTDLNHGVTLANEEGDCELFVSLHMNASESGAGYGTECWTANETSASNVYAKNIVQNINALGFRNRGVKQSMKLYELKRTKMPAIIVETLFCDNSKDVELYQQISCEDLAKAIANAIDTSIALN